MKDIKDDWSSPETAREEREGGLLVDLQCKHIDLGLCHPYGEHYA